MTGFAALRWHPRRLVRIMAAMAGLWLLAADPAARGQEPRAPLPGFDFQKPGSAAGWGELPHDVARTETTPEGLAVHIGGPDPYIHGPARDYPAGVPLLLKIRLKSSEGGTFQVFYFGPRHDTSEAHSARFAVRRGAWQEQIVPLPPLGAQARLRLDPPGDRGVCVIASITFVPRPQIAAPAWPQPRPGSDEPGPDALEITSGALVLRHHPAHWQHFTVTAARRLVAAGHDRPMIGYLHPRGTSQRPGSGPGSGPGTSPAPAPAPAPAPGAAAPVRWIDVAAAATVTARRDPAAQAIVVEASLRDPDGGTWRLRQEFRPGAAGSIDVRAGCAVDAPRDVVFLPLLLVLPGHGSFGALKGQALFAGIEYLENEPSSSTADLNGPGAAARARPGQAHLPAHGRAGPWPVHRAGLGARRGGLGPVRLARPHVRHRWPRAGPDRAGGQRVAPGRWRALPAGRPAPDGRTEGGSAPRSSAARPTAWLRPCANTSRCAACPPAPRSRRWRTTRGWRPRAGSIHHCAWALTSATPWAGRSVPIRPRMPPG